MKCCLNAAIAIASGVLSIVGISAVAPAAEAVTIQLSGYRQASDSPFYGTSFSFFHLENFEDGALNTPGVTASGGVVVGPNSQFRDSVDGDDGILDGSGVNGHSYYSAGANVLRFVFDPLALGGLPTHAGLVWTDSFPVGGVEFRAFDAIGNFLGGASVPNMGDGSLNGGTAEDYFFGFLDLNGIGAIEIGMPGSGDWEMDHLQYGRAGTPVTPPRPVPEPVLLPGIMMAGAIATRLRQRQQRSTASS